MSNRDPETGLFVKPEKKAEAAPKKVHPSLRPKQQVKKLDAKIRRTTVRTIKLVNPFPVNGPVLTQIPAEPSHNNKGTLTDPTVQFRHYLDKGFEWPYEFEGEIMADGKVLDHKHIFCAVKDCWEHAEADTNFETGSERCIEHEEMYRKGLIRYAIPGVK